jgi:hypothetical protein
MSLPLSAEEQTRQRNEHALRCLAHFSTSITPPEIAEQNRLCDQQVWSQLLNPSENAVSGGIAGYRLGIG